MSNQAPDQDQIHRELKIIIEVNEAAEQFYSVSSELGEHAAAVITNRHRSQLTNLENVANSAFKSSDVFDYIKRQTARYDFWRKPHQGHSNEIFGLRLLQILSNDLKAKRQHICEKLKISTDTDEGRYLHRHIYLLLLRQFIQQMVRQYEFSASIPTNEKQSPLLPDWSKQ